MDFSYKRGYTADLNCTAPKLLMEPFLKWEQAGYNLYILSEYLNMNK